MKTSSRAVLTLVALAGLGMNAGLAGGTVTVDSFVRAQSDVMFRYCAPQGGLDAPWSITVYNSGGFMEPNDRDA